jgi:hypothetical protein
MGPGNKRGAAGSSVDDDHRAPETREIDGSDQAARAAPHDQRIDIQN